MDIQGFKDRERAAESEYIRRKELEKAKARSEAKKAADSQLQQQQARDGRDQGQSTNPAAK